MNSPPQELQCGTAPTLCQNAVAMWGSGKQLQEEKHLFLGGEQIALNTVLQAFVLGIIGLVSLICCSISKLNPKSIIRQIVESNSHQRWRQASSISPGKQFIRRRNIETKKYFGTIPCNFLHQSSAFFGTLSTIRTALECDRLSLKSEIESLSCRNVFVLCLAFIGIEWLGNISYLSDISQRIIDQQIFLFYDCFV